jgi:hypothetical protein
MLDIVVADVFYAKVINNEGEGVVVVFGEVLGKSLIGNDACLFQAI